MGRIAAAMIGLIAALPVWAATPPGSVTRAPDGQVVVNAPPCQALMGGAAYVPGIDVNGNAVAPADLPSTPSAEPVSPSIRIDAQLAGKFGAPATGAGANSAHVGPTTLGYVTVKDGHAYLNGKPLDAEADAALIAACRAQAK
jgi:hypothetical protein